MKNAIESTGKDADQMEERINDFGEQAYRNNSVREEK